MWESDFDMTPICPRCGVSTATPSKSQGILEKLGRLFFVGNYRCHTCLKRFLWFRSPLTRPGRDRGEFRAAHRASAGG